MKICTRCKLDKELSEFTKNKETKDKLSRHCKDCCREMHIIWRDKKNSPGYKRRMPINMKSPKRPDFCGENNPNWKGGRTKLSVLIKSLPEYSQWRQNIYIRDDYSCQICGVRNGEPHQIKLDCDHIYPFSKIMEDYNIQSVDEALNCSALWDTENGRILCRKCHIRTDTYGLKFSGGYKSSPNYLKSKTEIS